MTLDKTWQEIYDAFPNVMIKGAVNSGEGVFDVSGVVAISSGVEETMQYTVIAIGTSMQLFTDSPNGYPKYSLS